MGTFIFVKKFFANYRYIHTAFSYIFDFSVPCRNTIWPARSSIVEQLPSLNSSVSRPWFSRHINSIICMLYSIIIYNLVIYTLKISSLQPWKSYFKNLLVRDSFDFSDNVIISHPPITYGSSHRKSSMPVRRQGVFTVFFRYVRYLIAFWLLRLQFFPKIPFILSNCLSILFIPAAMHPQPSTDFPNCKFISHFCVAHWHTIQDLTP